MSIKKKTQNNAMLKALEIDVNRAIASMTSAKKKMENYTMTNPSNPDSIQRWVEASICDEIDVLLTIREKIDYLLSQNRLSNKNYPHN